MSKPRAWNGAEQKEVAADLNSDTTAKRKAAIAAYNSKVKAGKTPKDNPRKATSAEGLLTISVGGQTIVYPPDFALGFQGAPLSQHAEQKIVDWAAGVLGSYQGSLQGAVINLMIFVQNDPCDYPGGCAEKLTSSAWLNTLFTSTGTGQTDDPATVNMDVWQTDDTNPGNISGIKSYCSGTINGIITTNDC